MFLMAVYIIFKTICSTSDYMMLAVIAFVVRYSLYRIFIIIFCNGRNCANKRNRLIRFQFNSRSSLSKNVFHNKKCYVKL